MTEMVQGSGESEKLASSTHKLIKKVTSDIDNMKFNTAIAAMMAYVNEVYDAGTLTKDELSALGKEKGLEIHTMHENIFNSMHRI